MATHTTTNHNSTPSLPLELLPLILHQVHAANRLQDLAACNRVSKTWQQWSSPKLWQRLWLRDHRRVRPVFATLCRHPRLCVHVKVLELRVYPLSLAAEELEHLEEDVATALIHMINLEELSWTRTGSLSNRLLPHLVANKPKLTHLELMGNTKNWSLALPLLWLPGTQSADPLREPLPSLKSIVFILPDPGAVRALIEISKRRRLRSINLLCQHSSVFLPIHVDLLAVRDISDQGMQQAAGLQDLECLILVGCKRMDGDSLRKLVKASVRGLRTLSIEDCGVHPSTLPNLAPNLSPTLATLTLTLPRTALCPHYDFYSHLSDLVGKLHHLREFTLYAPGGVRADAADGLGQGDDAEFDTSSRMTTVTGSAPTEMESLSLVPKVPLSFLRSLLTSKDTELPHRRLRMLRIHGIVCSLEALRLIGQDASALPMDPERTGLRDLVVQLEEGKLMTVIEHLQPMAPTLQTLHILARAGADFVLFDEDVACLAKSLVQSRSNASVRSGALCQIGFRHRVWEVHRQLQELDVPSDESDGSGRRADEVSVSLKRWDASEGRWPEALLVVKA